MGKPFVSSQLELARNRQRDSLEIFGQTSLLQQQHRAPGTQKNVPLFSTVPGSAWDDALKEAERLLEGNNIPTGRSSNVKRSEGPLQISGRGPAAAGERPKNSKSNDSSAGLVVEQQRSTSLDDIIGRLEAAEKDPTGAAKQWAGVLEQSFRMEDHVDQKEQDQAQQRQKLTHHQRQWNESSDGNDRRSRKSDESMATTRSEVSEDFLLERATQWGYGVTLKSTSKESTPRTSGASSTGKSRAGSSSSQTLPVVSRGIKEALSSFMLAFLVCDYTDPEMPILYASAGFTTMTGYATDEIAGKNCRFLQGPDTDRAELEKLKEALRSGSIYTGTLLNYKKDGTPFWNLLTLSPIKDDNGVVIKYIGMQAEQNSKEAQPRNSKGQKSPAIRPSPGPSKLSPSSQEGTEKQKRRSEEVGLSQRRISSGSSSTPRPPLVPQKASTAPAAAAPAAVTAASDRGNSGPELRPGEDPSRRMSQRYSLTSNPTRSTRNSTVEDFRHLHRSRNSSVTSSVESQQPQNRREASAAALQLREMVLNGGKSSSSFEAPGASTKRDSQSSASSDKSKTSLSGKEKSKTGRLTARILRLFRKDSKLSQRRLEEFPSGKDIADFSASDDERDDFTDNSVRSSEGRRHYSVGSYSTTASQQSRLEAPMDDLAERLARMTMNVNGRQQMPLTKPAYDEFCTMEPSSSSDYDGNKQQFCIVEPPSSSGYDVNKQQFCIVEPSAPPPPSPSPPFDGSNKQQFCIVHT